MVRDTIRLTPCLEWNLLRSPACEIAAKLAENPATKRTTALPLPGRAIVGWAAALLHAVAGVLRWRWGCPLFTRPKRSRAHNGLVS
jgi:hypothetical protein